MQLVRAGWSELSDILDIGSACAYHATSYGRRMSGNTLYIDGGANIMA